MRERDLFLPVKKYLVNTLGCHEVHGEVIDIDVIGVGRGYKVAVELKTSMSLKLLDQVRSRVRDRLTDYVYVAVPTKSRPMAASAHDYLVSLGVGILEVNSHGNIKVIAVAKRQRHIEPRIDRYLNDATKQSVGGVTSSEMDSPYKQTIEAIQQYMRRANGSKGDGWLSVAEILAHVKTHYATPKQSVVATLRASWNASWCETKKVGRTPYFRHKDSSYKRPK